MTRPYDSSRRKQAAAETRRRILDAALKLHWEGITEFEPLAREAGCSVPTVRKYFPTKESLFQDCTHRFSESLTMPDLEALARIVEPAERHARCIAELCRIHEAMFGYAWFGAHARSDSPTLDAVMQAYEGLVDAMVDLIVPENLSRRPLLRGLLDFLSYRALRLSGQLSPEELPRELITITRPLLADDESNSPSNSHEKGRSR